MSNWIKFLIFLSKGLKKMNSRVRKFMLNISMFSVLDSVGVKLSIFALFTSKIF